MTTNPSSVSEGGRVANLLEFPHQLKGCRVLKLTANYRSHSNIVATTGQWMEAAAQWETDGRAFRYAKCIAPHAPETHQAYPSVISVQGHDSADEARQVAELLWFLKNSEVIVSYEQVALLLHSVRDAVSGPYLDAS